MGDAAKGVQPLGEPYNVITANRRNGKPRSCEPCRKIKTRCDHRVPTCGRCQSRGIAHKCFYHPAPLTRNPVGVSRSVDSTRAQSEADGGAQPTEAVSSVVPPNSLSITSTPPNNSSFEFQATGQLSPALPTGNATRSIDEIQLAGVLSRLPDLDFISALIRRWYQVSQMCLVPLGFLDEALASLKAASITVSVEASNLASKILSASSKPLKILSSVEAVDFPKQFTLSNLRLEIVGVLLTVAGLAAFKLPANDTLFSTDPLSKPERHLFASTILSISDELINLCSKNFELNDIMIWLRSENLTLTMNLRENLNHHTWRISGQYFNDLLFLNFHRQSGNDANAPVFLNEIRSQFFASAFRVDKDLSATFAKLPRLPLHYCNRRLPLHLKTKDLLVSPRTLQTSVDLLNGDGWSVEPQLHPVVWVRARYIFSTFREELLYIELGSGAPDDKACLRNIIDRVHGAWNALPSYLHYDSNCWDANPSSNICFMLLVVYLEYLDLLFNIEKLMHSLTGRDDSALINTAVSLLNTTVSSVQHFSRNSGAYVDYVWSLIFYGLPSATVLATALKKSADLGQLASAMPWAELYRQLSALASNVEAVVELGDATSTTAKSQCKFLLKTLDEALNSRLKPSPQQATTVTAPTTTADSGFNYSSSVGTIDPIALDEGLLGDFMSEINWAELMPPSMNAFGL
ncbi:hypothetical protein F4825DRAFT_429741 [Nemania diffusa]|nr:hypothetical protein F4825DRAFT_429741 [Nemania diffusa]